MRLIIAEKPSVAMDIARALGQPQKHDGYVTVGTDTITWAYGHLVTLAEPDQYDPNWKSWSWAQLPMLPPAFKLTAIKKTAPHLQRVIGLMKQCDRIVAATDADREGELIFRYIYTLAGVKKPVDRLWLSENTPTAIRTALGSMKPAKAYDALAKAAQARAQADWLVGLNATRAVSLRHGEPGHPLSVGRVQTPTLKIIVDRDLAIAQFQPVPYWELHVDFRAAAGDYTGVWQGLEKEHPARIPDEATAQALAAKLPPGTPGRIDRVERKKVAVKPPMLFNLVDLQREANRRLGLTAQDTLDAAQHLYDQHLTSYPRTEARVITGEVGKTVAHRLQALAVGTPALRSQARGDLRQRLPRIVNDAAVSKAGHYAIIPTGQTPPANLSARDRAVYDLIARRFLATLLPPGQDERTTVWTTAAGERFKTTGTVVVDPGWRAALEAVKDKPDPEGDDEAEPDSVIPPGLQTGAAVAVVDSTVKDKQTKPPPRFTDASLLALMEKYGLGTPATRARILEVLLAREYITRHKKTLVSTDKGQHLLRVLPDTLQSPDLTGEWEARLEAIADAADDPRAFLTDIRQLTQDVVDAARSQKGEGIRTAAAALGPCPVCKQGEIRETPKGWGCSRWKDGGCRFTIWKTVSGKRLSAAQVKVLLAGKTTAVLKGFKSKKTGKTFEARLKLDGAEGRVTFVFDRRPPA